MRQNEALGLRRAYVDLDKAVIRVHWQIAHDRYRHGCQDPHACGAERHVYQCPPDCPKAKRRSGRKHVCRKPCPRNCTAHKGKCPKFCAPDCTMHAKACPQRIGGIKFVRPKGKRKRVIPIPVQLIPPLREHFKAQDAERAAAGETWEDWDLVWCRPIDTHDDWDEWKALLVEAGITKDARLHDARHTAGTLLGDSTWTYT
jgi:integrase